MAHDIGKFIKTRLKAIRKKQRELADHCGVSDNAVSKWIREGKISRKNSEIVAEFLKCTVDELLGVNKTQDEYVRQLLYFFDGLSMEHKDDLLYQAQRWYTLDNPEDAKANPFNGKSIVKVKENE